jgi:DNA-binding NtrC family response regulator
MAPARGEVRGVARRILVVDDEAPIRDLCARVLSRNGFEVTLASTGEDAVSRLQAAPYDLVISDIRMPGISGIDVLTTAKTLHPGIHVILITGFGTSEVADRANQGGVYRILTKPFDALELLGIVRKLLA